MYKNNAKLFVISAPSGCGKGTILAEVFKNIACVFKKFTAVYHFLKAVIAYEMIMNTKEACSR